MDYWNRIDILQPNLTNITDMTYNISLMPTLVFSGSFKKHIIRGSKTLWITNTDLDFCGRKHTVRAQQHMPTLPAVRKNTRPPNTSLCMTEAQ